MKVRIQDLDAEDSRSIRRHQEQDEQWRQCRKALHSQEHDELRYQSEPVSLNPMAERLKGLSV